MSFVKDQMLPNEHLVVLARQHILVLARAVLLNIIVAVLIALAWTVARTGLLLLYLPSVGYLIWKIVTRQKREYIVTDRRVVKHEGVLSITSFEAPLDKINNVFHEQSLLGRVFKYGDVGLETASEQGTTIFSFLPDPVKFKNFIMQQREIYTSSARAGDEGRRNIPRLIEELASLRDRNVITREEFELKKKALLDEV